jgi:hypothetical protein
MVKKRDVDRQVNVGDINHVSHDSNIIIGTGDMNVRIERNTSQNVTNSLEQLYLFIDDLTGVKEDDKNDLREDVKELHKELQAPNGSDESFLARRMRNIQRIAPDILDVVVATLSNPVTGSVTVLKKIADKIRSESKSA